MASAMLPVLELEKLSIVRNDAVTVLSELELKIEPGEHVALLGANGAGKSTLLRTIMGLEEYCGKAMVNGMLLEAKNFRRIRERTAMIFQNPDDQLFSTTVREDVLLILKNSNISAAEKENCLTQILEKWGITHLQERSPLFLSDGEKRRVQLAGVLIGDPELILLDEPSALLDPASRRKLAETLQTLPMALLIATHDLVFARSTTQRVVVLYQGQIAMQGLWSEFDQLMEFWPKWNLA